MTLADGKKPNNGEKWEDEELVATALVGEDIFIELKLEPEEAQDHQCFLLFRGDQLISPDRYSVQTRGNIVQLTLKQSKKDDAGHYSLVAKKIPKYPLSENGTQEGPRRRIRMNVQEVSNDPAEGEPPIFVRRLTDLAVKVGTRTRFLVEIRSSSNPKVTWHRNDYPVQEGSRFSFVHEGNFYCVDVAPVMVEDQGHWTCMVENVHGRSSCTSCLSVIVPKAYKPPEFVEELQALLSESGIVSLECKVIGVPTPVLRWFKDDQEIKAGNVFALTANADDPTSLGIYTCQATNCLGTAYSSSKVHVVGRGSREGSLKPADTLKPSGPLPVFKKVLNNESCKIGETITLFCQVQVPPWPKIITWYNKEGKVEPSDKYHILEDGLGTYSIEIKGVEAMDEGEWKCVATSDENVMQFTTCYVAMSIPRNYRVPRFMESLKAVLTEEGLVSFECKVVGFPIPLLRWFKDGQELKPGDVYQLTGTNSLGSYCCIARNCMGEAKSTAELTVEDIQNQLNEEERLQLLSYNQVPKFIKGLRSCEARIQEDFTFAIQVSVAPEPTLSWYRDDEPIVENDKYKITRQVLGNCHLEVRKLEFIDQAEWKCVAENDFGHSITSCFLKLIIPKHFKKPKFLESLRAILTEEGAVNLECKVIGVPQPVLTWYKDGVELKPGDIHRITSGQDGTCCLGIYTCKATNCMGSVSSSASLLGFEDKMAIRKEESKVPSSPVLHDLARNLSLSTIHEERTSQLYDTPQTDHSITMDDKGEVSFSFDGKEVSVSLYETPDLTEEEAIQIVEMYADQLSEHITEGNIIELPPMRFMKETSTTGNLLMEAVVIDVSPDYFAADEEADDLRTEADFEDVSIMDDQMQSILSSYSSPMGGERSVDRTPVSSPVPKPRTKKKRSGSDSSNSEKCDKSEKSQQKVMDWSESYHSAKEPSVHAQLSIQSQDSVDAFADALSSEGLAKSSSKDLEKGILRKFEAEENVEEFVNRLDEIAVASLQTAELNKEFYEATLMESLENTAQGKRKRKKKSSKGEIAVLSKTSSEESYTMNADENEPKEKIKRRKSKEKISREDKKDIRNSNKSTKNDEEKRQEGQVAKLELPKIESHTQEQYTGEDYEIDEEKLSLITSSVFSTAAETSEKLSQKEKLLENLKTLSNPVFMLRETLIDLDNVLMNSRTEVDEKILHELIVNKIVRPIENICEQMSVIENDAIESAGKRSLIQEVRILLLDSIGGPTEELLRGIELIKSHKSGAREDLKSDLIVLESLTDPVDEILASLAKIEYGLRGKEDSELSVRPKNPIILEKMMRAINQFGINLDTLLKKHQKASGSVEVLCLGERLQSVYQNLDSFLLSLPFNKITGAVENNADIMLIESLVRPLENLGRSLDRFSQSQEDVIEIRLIYELENSIAELKNKLETLTMALENYEKESEKHGTTEKNVELVNYLKWTMDDASDKLKKMKQSREIQVSAAAEDELKYIPMPAEKEGKLEQYEKSFDLTKLEEDNFRVYEEAGVEDETKISKEEEQQLSEDVEKKYEDISEKESEEPINHKELKSRRAIYTSRIASLESTSPELDENLPLPEMLLDPLIDVQAKLNVALCHYECQIPFDQASLPLTDLSSVLTELRECISSAAHKATTLNIQDTLNHIIDLKEPLLDLRVALSSSPSPEEYILVEEITKPLNELNEIILAVTRSSSVSEPSKAILNEMSKIMDDNLEQALKIKETTILPTKSAKPTTLKMAAVKPPEQVEQMSLTLSSIHFAMSSVLEKADEYSYDIAEILKPGSEQSHSSSAHKLISSINTLRQSIGDVAVAIAAPVIPENEKLEYNDNIVFEELSKLEEPLLNLQKILLTEKHDPEERHILNDVATPLRALKESILEVTKGQSFKIVQLLEDIEKDVSLVAMEALKKALIGRIDTEESSITDSTPGEVPKVITRWLDPIENWLASTSEEIDEKKEVSSLIAPTVDDFKRQLLKIAIQSSYSEPLSDVALIEELTELKEPLLKVCEVITSQHNPNDIELMEGLVQPTKHLLGTILDVSLIHQASSVLRPVLEALEQLENQIPLSIKMASYEKDLQRAVESLIPEESEQEKSSLEDMSPLDDVKNTKVTAAVIEHEETMEEEKFIVEEELNRQEEKIVQLENENIIDPDKIHEQIQALSVEQQTNELIQDVCNKDLNITGVGDLAVDTELLKQQKLQMATATARVEELDLWTLTILNPLDHLASTTLSLDRSIDEEVHSLLCRPLDSLHKQIELVESQINRPAGQSLENDVETIIEGFLSPMKQMETALKSAAEIWQKNPAKETVLKFLQDLVESSSDLYQQIDYLRNKLITEAPEQTLQVQKSEASLIETISAVLVPLEGIKEIITKMLEETTFEDKKDDDTEDLTLVADHTPDDNIKQIEQATARPLQELIEAIVVPENVRNTSTSPDIMQTEQIFQTLQEKTAQETGEKMAKIRSEENATAVTSDLQECIVGKVQEAVIAEAQENLATVEEQPSVLLVQTSQHVEESVPEEQISDINEQIIHQQEIEDNSSQLADHHDHYTSLMPAITVESQEIMEEINNLILSEIHGEKIDSFDEEVVTNVIDEKSSEAVAYCSEEIISEDKVQDVIAELPLEKAKITDIEELIEVKKELVENIQLKIESDNKNFLDQVDEIMTSELDRQNALSFKSESLMKDIDSAVREMMIKCPQICQEHIFEESVRDIVVEELLKVKGLIQTDDVAAGDGLTTKIKEIEQVPEVISHIIFDEKIHEIVFNEIDKQNIQVVNQENLIQAVETKIYNILSFPQNLEETVLEKNIRDIVIKEIQNYEQIAQEVSFDMVEEKINNLIVDEFKKRNIEITEENKNLVEIVKAKVHETILASPEMKQEDVLENKVQSIVTDELDLLEKNKILDKSETIETPQTPEIKHELAEIKSELAVESTMVQQTLEETVKDMVSEELEKQNIYPTSQEIAIFEAKIQEKINSYAKAVEENISEGLLKQIIIEQVQKYSAEITKTEDLNEVKQEEPVVENLKEIEKECEASEVTEEEISDFAPVKPEEQVGLLREDKTENVKIKEEEKILAYPKVSEEQVVEMEAEDFPQILTEEIQQREKSELKALDVDHLLEPGEIIVTDTQTCKQESDKKIVEAKEIRQVKIPEDEIRMMVINAIDKQNAKVIVDEKFVNNVTIKIQENIIKHPQITEENLLEESVQNIVKTEVEKRKADRTKVEDSSLAEKKEEMVKKLKAPSEKESMVLEEAVHDMISDELEKQHVQPSKHEDIINIIEQKIQNLIFMHPEEYTTNEIEENVQEIVMQTLEEQKVDVFDIEGFAKAEKREVKIEMQKIEQKEAQVAEQIIHEKIIAVIHKQNVEFSKDDKIIEAVENKVRELIVQHPEELVAEKIDEKVEDIVAETIKEQKIKISEIEMLGKADEQKREVKMSEVASSIQEQESMETSKSEIEKSKEIIENESKEILTKDNKEGEISTTQKTEISEENVEKREAKIEIQKIEQEKAQVAEQIIHEKIIAVIHKQNVGFSTDDKIIEAVENKVRELIIQHPEEFVAEKIDEKVDDIVAEAIKEQKIKISEIEMLGKADEQKREVKMSEVASSIQEQESMETSKSEIEKSKEIIETESKEILTKDDKCEISTTQKTEISEEKVEKREAIIEIQKIEQEKAQVAEQISHEKVIEAIHKQSVEFSKDDKIVEEVENKVRELFIQHPEELVAEKIDEKVEDIIAETIKEQKIKISEIEMLGKADEQKREVKISEVVPTIPEQESMETSKSEIEKSKEIIETESKEILTKDDKCEISTTQKTEISEEKVEKREAIIEIQKIEQEKAQVAEQIIHEKIIAVIHKQNVGFSTDDKIIEAVENKVRELIIQHPEEFVAEKIDEKVDDIVAEAIKEQKIKISEIEMLGKADEQKREVKISEVVPTIPEQESMETSKSEIEKSKEIIETESKEILTKDDKGKISTTQKTEISEEVSKETFEGVPEISKVSSAASEKMIDVAVSESKFDDIQKENVEIVEKLDQAVKQEEKSKEIDEEKKKNKKTERPLRRPSEMLAQVPEEVVHDIIIEEISKLNIQPSEEDNFIKAVEVKIQGLIALYPKVSKEEIHEENVRQIVAEQLKEEKAKILESAETLLQAQRYENKLEVLGSHATTQIQVPEEIVHELVVEELQKQNVELSQENNLVKAIETKIYDLIAQHPEISREDILEENVREIVIEKLEEQNASILEAEKLEKVTKQEKTAEVLNVPVTTQEQIPEEKVHEMIIEEFHKQNIEPLTEENLVKAVEAKVQDLIAQHPDICKNDILEENVKEIVTEEWTKQQANIIEIQNQLVEANKQSVQVEVREAQPEVQKETEMLISKELIADKVDKNEDDGKIEKKFEETTAEKKMKVNEDQSQEMLEDKEQKNIQEPLSPKKDVSERKLSEDKNAEAQDEADKLESQSKQITEKSPKQKGDKLKRKVSKDKTQETENRTEKFDETEKEKVEAISVDKKDRLESEIAQEKIEENQMLKDSKQEKIQKSLSPQKDVTERKLSKDKGAENEAEKLEGQSKQITEESPKQKGDKLKRKASKDKTQETEVRTEKEEVKVIPVDKTDRLGAEILQEKIEKLKPDNTQIKEPDNKIEKIKDAETAKIQDVHKEEIKSPVIEKYGDKEDQKQVQLIKKTEKGEKEGTDKKSTEKEISDRLDLEEKSKKAISINKKYGDEEIISKKLSAIKNNSEVDSSKSTIKDYSLKDRENQSIPPMIEIDYDDSFSHDLSSRRSNASTLSRKHRNLESLEYDDKSLGHCSSVTSRLPTFTPGPRDRGKKPSFCTKLTDRTAAEDSRIKLTCTILSDSELEVYWLKDGKILPPSSNKHGISLENGMASLELYGVKPKDSGEYSCIAKNPHGQASTEAKLKVYSGYEPTPSIPTFTRSIKDTYRKEENALVLECRVRAQPSPIITWLKDGQVLEIGGRYQQSDLVDGICRLKISNPDNYDSGLYTCRAENETMLSDRTSHLVDFKAPGRPKSTSWRSSSSYYDITGTDKDTGRPRFSSYLTDHSVPAGGTIALQVEVKGVPPPEITWMRTDKKGTISVPRAKTFTDSGVYTLIVPDATELETGTYVCRASNTYGHVDTAANVEVITGGKDGGKPAIFISRPPDKVIIVAVGEDVSVSFRAGGVPKPKVIWMKGLRDITNGPRSYKEGHDDYVRLTLKRACPSDEGTYCILLKNRYGCDRSFFSIQVKQRARSLTPSPEWDAGDTDNLLAIIHDKERSYLKQVPGPISSEPIVTDGGRNWLALTWGKPEQKGPAPVVAYRVDAWLLGGDGGARWVELGVTPVNAFDAFNLRPGEEYKFRITPRNRYGWGEPVTMTNSVTVREVVKFPEFTKILPGQLKALQGTILSLECEVCSHTTVQVKWYRDTTDIENGQDSRFTTYFNGIKSSLMIGNITESDSGRYVCEAINTAGRVSTFARVQVVDDPKIVEADIKLRKMRSSDTMNEERPPEFTMRLRDRRVQATYPVRLTCQVTGYPEPEVTWYKYREELQSHNNILIWNDEAHFHTLEISRSTIDDSGIYMARAKNAYGSVSCRCHLVVDKGIRAYIAPEFLGHLDAVYTVKTGGELRMTAQVEAYPTVGITWHRDGHRLRPSRDVVMTLNHDGTVELDLAHITPRDAGLYCCTATNEVGQAETTTRVVVLESEETKNINQPLPDDSLNIPYSKEPVFITKPLSTEAYEGDTVIILCEVVGDPKPEVMWLRDFLRHDYYKDAPHFRRVGAGPQYRLEIPYAKLDFTGTYSIIAKNCHGQAKAVISLQIYARGQGKEDNEMESTIKHGNVQTLPVIKRPLRDLRCCDGDAISLECKVHAMPEPDVRWEKGGKLVSLGGDFAIDYDGDTARLSIQHVYPEDEGEYTCVAYNDLGKAYTSACLIVDVPEGKETAISRRLTKPPGFLSPNSTPISTPRSTPVRSLSPSCISKREIKSAPKTSRGYIRKRPRMPTYPKFYAVPHNRVVEEGETVRFQCAIAGHPVPWVTWDKDGISITPTTRITLKENDDVRVLEITEVNYEDAGLYRVTLENDMGRTEASARLEIIRGRRNSASRSIGTRSASPRTYSIYGSRSNVSPSPRCDNSLRPPRFSDLREKGAISPTLPRWHYRNEKHSIQSEEKSNKITYSSEKNKMNRIIRSSSIPRSHQRFQERGKSEPKEILTSPKKLRKKIKDQPCQKVKLSSPKQQSSSISKENNVAIKSLERKPSLKSIDKNFKMGEKKQEAINIEELKAPVILTVPADVIALRGAKVILLSTYSGFPKPTVRWLRKGQDVVLDDKTKIKTNAGLTCLTLKEITSDEGGKYEIQVENQFGKESRFVNVTVEGPSEPPRDLVIIKNHSKLGEVTLSWRSPVYDGGSAITGYSIEMRKGNEPCWIAVAEAKYSLSHKIQRLDPEESYRFRVRAENIHGLSESGMESEIVNISSDDVEEVDKILEPSPSSEEDFEDIEPASESTIVMPEPGYIFEERFDVLEELGKGRYGVVRRILNKTTGSILAAKFVRTIKAKDKQQVHDEINIMNMLKHPKLLKLTAAFEGPKEMIMVTEYISGGELFERVVADDFTLTEKDSILFVRQICQAVEYLHNNKVVHLDLKPENIMCYTRTSHRIKLIDFGLAQTLKPDTPVRVLFGTPEFIPPEIISFEPIGTESDMWSVGVICYVLLTGLSPFMGENDAETFANITRADYDFDDKAFHAISQEAKDFISGLLIKRKELRMSARECLKHPWLAQCAESMSRVALPTDKLKKFIVRRKWQKTGNAIRALGRMAILSANSRKNIASSPPAPKEFKPENEKKPIFTFTEDSASEIIKQVLVKHESIQDLNETIDENRESVEEQPTLTDFSFNECLENADSPTIVDETLNLCIPEDDVKMENENSETIFVMSESNSPTSEHIDDLSTDFITELKIPSDEISKTDTNISDITDFNSKDVFTVDVDIKTLSEIIEVKEVKTDYAENFCSVTNLQISESKQNIEECFNELTENNVIIIDQEIGAKVVDVHKKEEKDEKKVSLTRPNFISLQNNTHLHESTSKPWCQTNSSSLDNEDEISRIKKPGSLHRVVRTGSVSRTAKMFEKEEISLPIKQSTSPGSRNVFPDSNTRPRNERIQKAFAFWNK